ncbi:hypothetical protein B4168_3997 [Anoxybacillus flavithermus]|nr:hypothetical protein B4168_3997 [Anoxybacillus flavithermus]
MYLTYEELKPACIRRAGDDRTSLYLTYEELKLERTRVSCRKKDVGLYLTYEELKQILANVYPNFEVSFVSYL